MTDMDEGRAYRAGIARMTLAEYEDYLHHRGKYADPHAQLGAAARSSLVSCARWLLDEYDAADAASGPRVTARANTAVRHLDTGQMRDVLNVLALRVPAAVLDATAEAGHGHA